GRARGLRGRAPAARAALGPDPRNGRGRDRDRDRFDGAALLHTAAAAPALRGDSVPRRRRILDGARGRPRGPGILRLREAKRPDRAADGDRARILASPGVAAARSDLYRVSPRNLDALRRLAQARPID